MAQTLKVAGKTYPLDANLTFGEAAVLRKATGWTYSDWVGALTGENSEAVRFLAWACVKRAEPDTGPFSDFGHDLWLDQITVEDDAVEPDGDDPEVPTSPVPEAPAG